MNHRDHVNLLRPGISGKGGIWADLGSGSGAFTLALRELIGPEGEIYSIDKDGGRLREQERNFQGMFPGSNVHFRREDFTRPLDLPPLDGVVMANSLHYFRDKVPLLMNVRARLKSGGSLLLVEYNTDSGNPWVPHPLSFETFRTLAARGGFVEPRRLATIPSRFLGEIYSAAALNP
jgi:SAM-dependent methyltransferase